MRDPDVTHFRMRSSMHQAAIHHASSADAGADGQIQKLIEALRSAPARFPERGGIHVGIERHFHFQRLSDGACEVEIPPRELRRCGDIAVGW